MIMMQVVIISKEKWRFIKTKINWQKGSISKKIYTKKEIKKRIWAPTMRQMCLASIELMIQFSYITKTLRKKIIWLSHKIREEISIEFFHFLKLRPFTRWDQVSPLSLFPRWWVKPGWKYQCQPWLIFHLLPSRQGYACLYLECGVDKKM